jgi:AraC-like DNA-binding protein
MPRAAHLGRSLARLPSPLSLSLRHRLGGYREFGPPPALANQAEAIWIHRTPSDFNPGDRASHLVLPDPSFCITFECFREEDGTPRDPRLMVVGPKTRSHMFPIERGYEVAAVRLKIEWVLPIFDWDPFAFRDTADDLAAIQPTMVHQLEDLLVETRTAEQALTVLVATLTHAAASANRVSLQAATAVDLVRRSGGRLPIERVAEAMGLSVRYLRRVVRREAGLSLKKYARTVRLVQTMVTADRVGERSRPPWARLAAEGGFSDQAHLVRECQAMCGLTPHVLFEQRRAERDPDSR